MPPLTSSPEDLPAGPVPISTGVAELVRDRDDPQGVFVMVNGVPSSYLKLDAPEFLAFEYMQQMACVLDGLPLGPVRVVHLGAAGCTMARYIAATRPGSQQIGVDLDGVLMEHVRTWFNLPRSPQLRLRTGDAREQLATLPAASADVIIRDAFAPDVTPPHLQTMEFLADVQRVLGPGGVYLANTADGGPLSLARSEIATAAAVVPPAGSLALIAENGVLKGRRHGNLVVAATFGESFGESDVLTSPQLVRRLRLLAVPASLRGGSDLRVFAGTARPRRDQPQD